MNRPQGILCYDRDCAICRGLIARWGARLRRGGFSVAGLQDEVIQRRLALRGTIPDEMKLIKRDGSMLGGADALIAIAEAFAWTRPLAWSARLPPFHRALDCGYRWFAAHRHCLGGACRLRSPAVTTKR